MAIRYIQGLKISIRLTPQDVYKCVITNTWLREKSKYRCEVLPPKHLTYALDSKAAYDRVAEAARSFMWADEESERSQR